MCACVYTPPIRERPAPADNAPFYFPTGVTPSLDQDVVLDLTAGDTRTFGLQVFDTDPTDDLQFTWVLIVPDGSFVVPINSGSLTGPQEIGDVFAWEVPPVVLQSCQGLAGVLDSAGDMVVLQLTINDPIPEQQRFDPGAVAYQLVVRWTIEAVGNCSL